MKLLILAFGLVLAGQAPAAAQSAEAGLSEGLRALYLDPGFRQDLRDRGFTGEKFDVMVDHYRALYSDPAILDGILRQVRARVPADGRLPGGGMRAVAQDVMADSLDRGLLSVSPSDRWLVFRTEDAFTRGLTPADCAAVVTGRMAPARERAMRDRFLSGQSAAFLRAFYRTERTAIRAGVSGRAPPRLSPAERARAEEALLVGLDGAMQAEPDAARLYRDWRSGAAGRGANACTFDRLVAQTLSGMAPGERDLVLRFLLE